MKSEFELHRAVQDTAFDQQNAIQLNKNDHTFKAGIDYTVNAKTNLGVMVTGNWSTPEVVNRNITTISHRSTNVVDKLLVAENATKQRNTTINANINYTYKDTAGRSLVVNADYGYYDNNQDQVQPNSFFDASGKNLLYQRHYKIASPTRIDIYSLKADYGQHFAGGRLSIGAKLGRVETDNHFNQFDAVEGGWKLDKNRSNFFRYLENVNAAYINYAREWKSLAIQGGIRVEQTSQEGKLRSYKNVGNEYTEIVSAFQRDYVDVFPSITLTFAPGSANQIALAFSRRIDRPVYQNLNPFEYRINEYTYHKGSIDLRPQYSNTVSLTHTYKLKLNTTLAYSRINDLFGELVDTAQGVKGYLVNQNIAVQDITSLNLSYPLQWKNYSLFTNVNTYYSAYKADLGTNRHINLSVWAVNVYAQNSYRFGKGWSAEISGFYASPSIWKGTMKTASMWSADAGLQKQLFNGNGTIKASVSDLFKSMKWSATSHFAGQDVAVAGRYDSRQFKLAFSYRFGNHKLKATRQYKTGLEEENNRAQGSGGFSHQ